MPDPLTPNQVLQLVIPSIAFVFTLSFLCVWAYQRNRRYLILLSLSFATYAVGSASQILHWPTDLILNALFSAGIYILSILTLSKGIIQRSGLDFRWRIPIVLSFSILLGIYYFSFFSPNLTARIYILNFGGGLMILSTVMRIHGLRKGKAIDRALFWVLLVFGISFFLRTMLTMSRHWPNTPHLFGETAFWLTLQFSMALFVVLLALILLAAATIDVVDAIVADRNRTERQAEAALRESEERFRGAFDNAAHGMALVLPNGRWLKVNDALCAMLGYSESEFLATDIQGLTHPDDLAETLMLAKGMLAGTRHAIHVDRRFRHKDGHVVSTRLAVSLVRSAEGVPRHFVLQIQDISAEEAARSTRELLAAAIENFGGLVALFDADDRLIVATSEYDRLLTAAAPESRHPATSPMLRAGMSFEQLTRELVSTGDIVNARGREEAWIRERVAAHRAASTAMEIRRSDGTWYLAHDQRLPDGGTIVVESDITEIKEANDAVNVLQSRLLDAVESIPAIFMLYGPDERLILANSVARREFAHAAGTTAPGAPFEALVRASVAHEDVSEPSDGMEARVRDWLAQFDGRALTETVQFQDGRWFQRIERRTDEGGRLHMDFDITNQKSAEIRQLAAESELRTVMDHTIDGLITIDEEGVVQSFSKPAEQIFGHEAGDVIGRNVSMLMPEPFHSAHDGYLPSYMSSGVAQIIGIGREVQGLRKDGSVFPMDLAVGEIHPFMGGRRFVGTVRDISARKAMEARLEKAHRLEAMGQITGGVAHDFNNILAAILINLELLQSFSRDNPEVLEHLQAATRSTIRGRSLTKQLLVVAGQQSLQPRPITIRALVEDVVRLLKTSAGAAYEIDTDIRIDAGDVLADAGSLESALLNLVLNARDAMPDGGVITIATAAIRVGADGAPEARDLRPGDYVGVSVQDTGIGMSPETASRAAEPFFTTKPGGKGSGLGLSMVFGFAKQSGGHVAIRTAPGAGTCVTLYLPKAAPVRESEEAVSRPVGRKTRSAHILLVEDDDDLRQSLSTTLASHGYKVTPSTTATAALETYGTMEKADLVLTDVVVPGKLNGVQMAEKLRAMDQDIPVILMSGYVGDERVIEQILSMGYPLLTKPFTHAELLDAISAAMAGNAGHELSMSGGLKHDYQG